MHNMSITGISHIISSCILLQLFLFLFLPVLLEHLVLINGIVQRFLDNLSHLLFVEYLVVSKDIAGDHVGR